MATEDESRLTDAEYWILLSLDDASLLAGLLCPVVKLERRRSRLPWPRWDEHELRPSLDVREAAQALTRLVARGRVEVREVRRSEEDPGPSPGYSDLGYGPPMKVEPHPLDRGRALSAEEVTQVVNDPRNWRYPAEVDSDMTYWAAATEAGEAAYHTASRQRGT